MVPLDDPTAGRSTPVLAKREVKALAAKPAAAAGERVGFARRRSDLPAGRGGTRHGGGLVADQEAKAGGLRAYSFARGQRKTPCRCEIGHRAVGAEFGDDTGERTAAQRLLHRPQPIDRFGHAEHQQVRRGKSKQIEAGAVRPATLGRRVVRGDPEDLTAATTCPGSNRCGKAAGGGEMHRCGGRNLMQGSADQPAAEHGVDGRGKADQALLDRQPRCMSRVDSRKNPAEIIQRGRGRCRSRTHGRPF